MLNGNESLICPVCGDVYGSKFISNVSGGSSKLCNNCKSIIRAKYTKDGVKYTIEKLGKK